MNDVRPADAGGTVLQGRNRASRTSRRQGTSRSKPLWHVRSRRRPESSRAARPASADQHENGSAPLSGIVSPGDVDRVTAIWPPKQTSTSKRDLRVRRLVIAGIDGLPSSKSIGRGSGEGSSGQKTTSGSGSSGAEVGEIDVPERARLAWSSHQQDRGRSRAQRAARGQSIARPRAM